MFTLGPTIVLDLTIHEQWRILAPSTRGWVGCRAEILILLHGTAPIERVEIISADNTVWESEPGSLDVELEGSLPAPEGAWAYYYLRLRQEDGHRAWLSPVWIDA